MGLTWLITRPLDEALPLVEQLAAKGVAARALPAIERVEQPWPAWPAQPKGVPVLLVTSGAVVPRIAARWPALAAQGVQVAAMAPATSGKLREAGVPVAVEAPGGVRALADAVARWAEGRALDVFYPTSDAAERQPEHRLAIAALERLGARVTVAPVYEVRPAQALESSLSDAAGRLGVFLASPSAVEAFVVAATRRGLPPPAAAVVLGVSTLRAWKTHAPKDWPRAVLYERSADLADTLSHTGGTP